MVLAKIAELDEATTLVANLGEGRALDLEPEPVHGSASKLTPSLCRKVLRDLRRHRPARLWKRESTMRYWVKEGVLRRLAVMVAISRVFGQLSVAGKGTGSSFTDQRSLASEMAYSFRRAKYHDLPTAVDCI